MSGLALSSLGNSLAQNLFQDPEFQKRFMGSYGFLPDVEPEIDPNDEEETAYFLEVKELLAADNMAGLKAKLMQDMDPDVSHAALQFMLANLHFQDENNADAEKWYLSAIRKFPSYLRAHKNLGLVYFQKGENELAIESLSKAVQLGDREAQTTGLLGICHMNQENWLAAESALRQAVVLEPKNSQWKQSLMRVFFNSEQYEAALSLVNQGLMEKPDDDRLWLMKGRALMELNRPQEASVAFETLRHLGKATPEIMEILGAVYMDQEKSNAALSAYLGAAKASSKLKGSSVLRTANLLFGYQYIDQSKRYISQLRPRLNELTPDEQLKLKTLEAKIARSEGDNGAAMAALHDIILKDNRNGEARVELAQLYAILAGEAEEETKKAEHLARAKLYFDQAMQIEDSQAMAALRYGQMLVGQAEYIKAVPLLKKAYELRPRDEVDQYVKRVERAARRQQEKEDADRKAASLPTTG
jgi:tetratricopeptide (TPR) repeat protein